jgi:Protein of unknown function (DUF3551)
VPQVFFETLHRNPPQKIHIQLCCRITRLESLDESARVRLVSMKVEPARRGSRMRRFDMRKAILAVLAASGLAALGAAPAEAVGTRYPFCLQGDEFPGLSHCTFTSYEQCQATASGRFLSCIANPYYVGDSEPPSAGYRPLRGRALPPAPGYSRY